jgi:hypothetical protein
MVRVRRTVKQVRVPIMRITPRSQEDRRLRAATNRVEKADGPFLQLRFDAPEDPNVTDLEGISRPGDSGGPAYIERAARVPGAQGQSGD